jgi:hypothetical protein
MSPSHAALWAQILFATGSGGLRGAVQRMLRSLGRLALARAANGTRPGDAEAENALVDEAEQSPAHV